MVAGNTNTASEGAKDMEVLTLREVADRLRISLDTARRWYDAGQLPGALPLIGKRLRRVQKDEFDAWLRTGPQHTANAGLPVDTSQNS
jgi:excisionase family DNA binding protein